MTSPRRPVRPLRSLTRVGAWLPAVVAAVGLLVLSAGTASAATLPDSQTRVRACAPETITAVGVSEHITAGQGRGPPVLQRQIVVATGVAAEAAGDAAGGVARSPSFVVKPNGETVIVPKGASGPELTESGKGFQFTGGSGGHGLGARTTDVRIMDPVTSGKYPYPEGYVSYSNGAGQAVNPFTGQTVAKSSPWWHWPFG